MPANIPSMASQIESPDSTHAPGSRRVQRLAGGGKTNWAAELGLLGLCFVAGAAGIYFEDVRITCTIFMVAVFTWIATTIPTILARAKARAAEDMRAEDATRAAGGAADPRAGKAATAATAAASTAVPREVDPAGSSQTATEAGSALPSPEQVLHLIKSRRSVFTKDYSGDKVPRHYVEQLLEAANWAPTHHLTQPWRFVVLEGDAKARFESLTISCVAKYTQPEDKAAAEVERIQGKAAKTWPKVSHYIVICMARRPGKNAKLIPEWEDMAAVACAVQNMHLMATSLGVAAYWSSWQEAARTAPEMADFLGLDTAAGDKCLGVFSLGCSERISSYRGSRGPFMDKVQWKSW